MYTFAKDFWYGLNAEYGLLFDEYEGEEIPVAAARPIAAAIRSLNDTIDSEFYPELQQEILQVTAFIESAADSSQSVTVCL